MITEIEINQYGCTALDTQFQRLGPAGLTWYPWVGKQYFSAPVKVWVIPESHYLDETGQNHSAVQNPLYTRRITAERLFPQWFWKSPTLDKLNQTLAGRTVPAEQTHFLWENVTLSNLIQRPMSSPKERPCTADFSNGWNMFAQVLDILKPDFCLFVGLAGINRLDTLPGNLHIKTPVWTPEKIDNAYAREIFSVSTNAHRAQAAAISHPGHGFSPQKWHQWLKNRLPDIFRTVKIPI